MSTRISKAATVNVDKFKVSIVTLLSPTTQEIVRSWHSMSDWRVSTIIIPIWRTFPHHYHSWTCEQCCKIQPVSWLISHIFAYLVREEAYELIWSTSYVRPLESSFQYSSRITQSLLSCTCSTIIDLWTLKGTLDSVSVSDNVCRYPLRVMYIAVRCWRVVCRP